jgi:hypothetical protein
MGVMEHPQLFSARVTRLLFYGWSVVLLVAIALLGVRATGEGDRTQSAVTAAITAEQQRQAAEQDRQGRALCAIWKGTAEADVLARSSEVVRSQVRTAAAAYQLVRCDERTGPLGLVDPEAYKPAPPS